MDRKIRIPESLTAQAQDYRLHVRKTKLSEALGIAVCLVLLGFGVVFLVDRWTDAGVGVRTTAFALAVIGLGLLPFAFARWVSGLRSLESVAKLLSKKLPSVGDSLLGALELAKNKDEQDRSPALCQAALNQVAEDSSKRNLLEALPPSKHRTWVGAALGLVAGAIALALVFPDATWNAWQRFLMPMASIERFTFTSLESIPKKMIVPHGEEFSVDLKLASHTQWKPPSALAQVGRLAPLQSDLSDGQYSFEIPAQIAPTSVNVVVGDAQPSVDIEPSPRPELEKLSALIKLPEYLQIPDPLSKDIRGGALSVVRGARLQFQSKTTKPISTASASGEKLPVVDGAFVLPEFELSESKKFDLQWKDIDGLQAKSTFPLQIQANEDEQPSVFGDGLPKARVLLDSEQIQFTVRALDDFGVKHVGLEWRTLEESEAIQPERGEWMLAAGGPNSQSLDALATFQATKMKVPSRPVEVRLFVEDYLPDRGRVYSNPHLLFVLTPSDHAAWVLEQMTRWQRESMEVRDRELQLLATNKQIRDLSEEELNNDKTRSRIEQQASAEQANGRRLANLTGKGEDLLRQAARNPEIGVGHLEKWAEMQKILKDIAANRMPCVADLLKKASREDKLVKASSVKPSTKNSPPSPMAGQDKDTNAAPPGQSPKEPAKFNAPTVVDKESSQQPIDPTEVAAKQKKESPPSALRLPSTTLAGMPPKPKEGEEEEEEDAPPANDVEDAVQKQEELLAEFDKVADELNELMANLEGSTLVKRLKAASREQLKIADVTATNVNDAFGVSFVRLKSEQKIQFKELEARETKAADFVSMIIDDMHGFHERRPSEKFESVLAEIKTEDVVTGLRKLSERILNQQGLAIAEAEYWSDTLDRWAEDIVDPACKGECKGSKSKSSLPPSIVLEVMQILEEEMNLRERTRVAEQSKAASTEDDYLDKVDELTETQMTLKDRVDVVKVKIEALPDAEQEFPKEIELMGAVSRVMLDCASILDRPETGRIAVAAETEAIELLLQTKRINPNSGGGGGSDPGGGGGGTTDEAAIAMIGPGVNQNERRQDHGVQQQTGTSNNSLPEEFRYGLDEYFQKIDRKSQP